MVTVVFPLAQLRPCWIAWHIWDSILRMWSCVCLTLIVWHPVVGFGWNGGHLSDRTLLISEHSEVSINNEVDDLIRCANVETIAEPIDAHFSGHHGIEHEILQVLQGLGVGEKCFVHAPIIGTGSDALGSAL
jgi:hypothetical protein